MFYSFLTDMALLIAIIVIICLLYLSSEKEKPEQSKKPMSEAEKTAYFVARQVGAQIIRSFFK
ncbi:hypothetical protein IJ556_04940 [bacterium]|nr:hypothetical protein [bacterium]